MDPLRLRSADRQGANPPGGILRIGGAKNRDSSIDQRNDHAADVARRQRSVVEVASFYEDDGVGAGGTEAIELRPQSARYDRSVEVTHGLPLDTCLRPDGVVAHTESGSVHLDPENLERLDDAAMPFAMIRSNAEPTNGNHNARMNETTQLI